ncbi:MAG: hypothetical protein ABI560_14725, partial [Myxococcales bacterium]
MDETIATDAWGIDDKYRDVKGAFHEITPATRAALKRAMGLPDQAGQDRGHDHGHDQSKAPAAMGPYSDVVVLRGETSWSAPAAGQLRLEGGSSRGVGDAEQVQLPLGYHEFTAESATGGAVSVAVRIIVAPAHCHLPDGLRVWGWAAQLYATRSRQSWGI